MITSHHVCVRLRRACHYSYAPLSFITALLLLTSICASAVAQDRASQSQEQGTQLFIYGASFRDVLQDLPQSATVVQEERFVEKGETSFQYEIESIPNLTWSGGSSRPRFFLIRGVGELEQYEGAPNPSVATIVDDIDFSGLGVTVPIFDLEQVEVLRGPQGIRFGSSALAGAINLRSHDPTEFTSGTLTLMAGNDEMGAGGFAVGGSVPGSDGKLQLRVSAFNQRSDGFRDNLFLNRDDTNSRNESLVRLKLRYQQSAALVYDLAVWGSEFNNGYDAFAIDNSFITQSDKPGQDDTRVGAASFKIGYRATEAIKVESISSLMRTKLSTSFDGDWGNNPFWEPFAPYDYFSDSNRTRRTLSQEIRTTYEDPLYEHGEFWRWVGGLYGHRLMEDTTTDQFADDFVYDSITSDYRADTGAAFGDVEMPLGCRTSLSTGLRFEQRNARYDDSRLNEFSPAYSMLGGTSSLQHDITDRIRGYATVARGFKGGGFNVGPSVPSDRRQYDPEYLWNYETGIKGSFLDKRLMSAIAVFHDQRYDQHLKFAIQNDPSDPLSFTYITESAAQGRSTGVELENSYRALPWWEIFASGSIMNSEFTDVPEESAVLEGRSFSVAPTWQYSTGTRFDFGSGFFLRLEETGRDAYYFDDSHNQKSDPYNLFNATVGYRQGGWKLLLWTRNLFNESYAVRGFFFGNEPPDFPNKLYIQRGDPRTFGATISYTF